MCLTAKRVYFNHINFPKVLSDIYGLMDANLWNHSVNVFQLSNCLYSYLPKYLSDKIDPSLLEYAAFMHDIGKLKIPRKILNKPGKLDNIEWDVMKMHPMMAIDILDQYPYLYIDEIKEWILYHHERIDGKGYYGISGENIPLGARIIAVCDTYSAITMRRSYKAERSYAEAIDIIKSVASTQLDKNLVDIFIKIPKREIDACSI